MHICSYTSLSHRNTYCKLSCYIRCSNDERFVSVNHHAYLFLESSPKLASGTTEDLEQKKSPSSSQLGLTFIPDKNIQHAFRKLSAGVKSIIRNSNFNVMQEACMEEAKSPNNFF